MSGGSPSMVLVDTSVWVDHLRVGDPGLVRLLEDHRVRMHPFVVGELACGNLSRRDEVLDLLRRLPGVPVADQDEVLFLIERHRLMGRGIGFVDAHLLAATRLSPATTLWTRDRRLAEAARGLGVDDGYLTATADF
ncbi:type II toxin-antitoxin system VapC family toxin [Alcanivorax marinus]|uniref:Ribonuclease VapC n=1 Tax=Alloalcanivorax marinus TaxID=1177169 RepID=A0A9Q3UQM1_9GAMM|nr:type II toxin-antitoxin system VapC family toxin [Alloalcanivorax marinus]MCC4309724.1 type II toxin-antitoxin system VapC family toxin [Alloalcanivorax marinus]MCU5787130.1 PilT protein-like protein [Alloalcanivorax marinus]